MQVARHLAGVLPVLEVRRDLAPGELPGHLAQRLPLAHVRSSGISTYRERAHSPSPFACGSNRVDAATPCPSSPCSTTLTPPRLGRAKVSTSRSRVSGSSVRTKSGVTRSSSHATRASYFSAVEPVETPSRETQSPRLASPPLSPDRAWTNVPSGAFTRPPPSDRPHGARRGSP